MTLSEEKNRQYLLDLFAGPFRGQAIIMEPEMSTPDWREGDVAISKLSVKEWLPKFVQDYETKVVWNELLNDDSVPYAKIWSGTEIFAAAFGCKINIYTDSPPCALPLVTTAGEADRLSTPDLNARPLERIFHLGQLVRERLGPNVPIGVPDIQSPFDIAALIWKKEEFFVAMHENPTAVKKLVEKCNILLKNFLKEFKRQFPNCNLCHYPYMWVPPELGCWLSEDEVGSISAEMFEEFCAPVLSGLSEEFGGLFMHCCANADHQHQNFNNISNMRGLNRVFKPSGLDSTLQAFAGRKVLIITGIDEKGVYDILDRALPGSRFLFSMPAQSIEGAKDTYQRLRERCPRSR